MNVQKIAHALEVAQKYKLGDFDLFRENIFLTDIFEVSIPGVKAWARITIREDVLWLSVVTTSSHLYTGDIPEHVMNHETLAQFVIELCENFYL